MKKMFLMLGVAAAAMTSCTSDEVLEVNPASVIKFESFVNKGTRAVTSTDGDITKFYVFGYHGTTPVNDFINVEVSKGNEKWDYDGDVYWTVAQYYFGAYATKNESEQLTIDDKVSFANGTLTFTDYTVNDANDLVAALVQKNVDAIDGDPGTVDFNFQHLLSKIQFTFVNNVTDHKMYISEVEIAKYPATGTCTYSSTGAVWNSVVDSENKTLSATAEDAGIVKGGTYSDNFLVIPTAAPTGEPATTTISDEYTVTFKATFKNASGETVSQKVYPATKLNAGVLQWKPGYVYNYTATLELDQKRIEFGAPTVTDWNSDLDGNQNQTDDDITLQQ